MGGFAGREMADVWQFCPVEEEWTQLQVEQDREEEPVWNVMRMGMV